MVGVAIVITAIATITFVTLSPNDSNEAIDSSTPVSYTHLTLPTKA